MSNPTNPTDRLRIHQGVRVTSLEGCLADSDRPRPNAVFYPNQPQKVGRRDFGKQMALAMFGGAVIGSALGWRILNAEPKPAPPEPLKPFPYEAAGQVFKYASAHSIGAYSLTDAAKLLGGIPEKGVDEEISLFSQLPYLSGQMTRDEFLADKVFIIPIKD